MPVKRGFAGLLGLGSQDEARKPVQRATDIAHLDRTRTSRTELDLNTGRTTVKTFPGGVITPAGQFVPDIERGIRGECVMCREEFDEAGEPNRTTLVPKNSGGGGVCIKCLKIYCADHGGLDDEGRFWCGDCAWEEQMSPTAILAAIGNLFRGRGAKDE